MKINRLSKETSPYLQQHAENPVDWYPWSKEALAKAKTEKNRYYFLLVIQPVIGATLWRMSLLKI